ncbi:L-xylulose reductase [Nesidiocoris tenuis]|uniref:L-xylulose reductase n=1 Tax=Nesidiocoris tenuis TaxID=355587 RepID=A0ABN7B3Z9_9HEMI|nr:L-xylulose reductase [Nesidiocoris tenuis]
MEISFAGKRVLVTGAGQGIGRELAKKLVSCGATVTALSKTENYLKTLKDECPPIKIVAADVGSSEIRAILRQHGPFDCLVNNAALAILEPVLETKEESFDLLFNVNVKGVFVVSQEVARMMVDNKIQGSIVNISSQASKCALRDHLAYCASKSAVDMMSKVMALELGAHGIRVNCVNPTVVLTAMGRLGWSDPAKAGPLLQRIPLNRFAEVEEVVNVVLFLLSDKASMVNAVEIPIDGGFLSV